MTILERKRRSAGVEDVLFEITLFGKPRYDRLEIRCSDRTYRPIASGASRKAAAFRRSDGAFVAMDGGSVFHYHMVGAACADS